MTPTPTPPSARQQMVLDVPLHRHLGLTFEACADGVASARFDVGPQHIGFGGLHGGVLYTLMDAVAMLALLTRLGPAQHAVTHDLHVSLMRSAAPGARVLLEGRIVRLGRTIAFIDVTARVDDSVIATGRLTKSLVVDRAG